VSFISGRLLALAAFLARRYGVKAVSSLARSANAWLADPANEAAKQQLVAQLREWSRVASGGASRTAAALAWQVEKRKVSTGAWERDLMDLRYELPSLEHGPIRQGAVRAYESQLRAGVHLISGARSPERTREEVLAALRAEATMLRRERLTDDERARLLAATEAAIAACSAMFREADGAGARPRGR
jgi:hypothetical protein